MLINHEGNIVYNHYCIYNKNKNSYLTTFNKSKWIYFNENKDELSLITDKDGRTNYCVLVSLEKDKCYI